MRVASDLVLPPTDGRHDPTTRRRPVARGAHADLLPTHRRPIRHIARRGPAHHRPADRRQPPPHPRRPRPRTPDLLPAGPLGRPLVRPRTRVRPRPASPRPVRPGRPRPPRRRRHRREPSGSAGLREGPPPRPGPVVPRVHRVAVRSQVGRGRRPRPVPVRHPPVGAARPRGPLPPPPGGGGGGRGGGRAPPPPPART